MNNLEKYWEEFTADSSGTFSFTDGYICPYCGTWVPYGTYHSCWAHYYNLENKTEKAYRILKKLVEKEIIEEPNSFKKFCELIEEIAGII